MIEAGDLMFGDWVMVKERKDDDVKDYPIMVYSGNIGDIVAGDLIVEPIPITKFLIEKINIFKYSKELDVYYLKELDGINFWFGPHSGGMGFIIGENSKNYHGYFGISYIHELQHVLKIFKIKRDFTIV